MGTMALPTQAYSLRISKQPAPFSVLSLSGCEAISQTYQFVIEFTCARWTSHCGRSGQTSEVCC
jgi:type VI secretion system secreted protein VgrG